MARRGILGQSGHRHDIARQGDDEARTGIDAQFSNFDGKSSRCSEELGIVGERVLRLGNTDGHVVIPGLVKVP